MIHALKQSQCECCIKKIFVSYYLHLFKEKNTKLFLSKIPIQMIFVAFVDNCLKVWEVG